jgi:acyl-CoA thioesterase-1
MVTRVRQLGTAALLTILLTGVLLVSEMQSTMAAPRVDSRMKTILVLGDSLSDGFHLPRSQAYPDLIAARLRQEGMRFEVINASASGGTTAGGLQRLPPHLRRPIDIFIIQLGINDLFRGVPVDQTRKNLQAIIDRAKARHPAVEIVIAGMQLPVDSDEGYLRAFGEMYSDLAKKNNSALIPYLLEGVAGDPSLSLPDRIHPNAQGQRVVAENVWRALEPVARRVWEKP